MTTRILATLLLLSVAVVSGQRYFAGIGKQTWGANRPGECLDWFQRYLSGVQREANECAGDVCPCSQQGRVHIVNATGTQGRYRPLAPFNNGSWDLFGLHTVNCSYHSFGTCSLGTVEQDFQAQFGAFNKYVPLMDHNLGLWIHSLGPLLAAFDRDGVDYLPLQWRSNRTTYYSAMVNPCGMVLIEFISTSIGSLDPSKFTVFNQSRVDFDLPVNIPAPPSVGNQLQLTPLKISRATYKIDEVEAWYTRVMNATVLKRVKFDEGGEKLVLKLPDVSTGRSTVQLQFWSPNPSDDVSLTSTSACGGWTVRSWEAYMNTVARDEIRSPTCGFPKVLDFHFSYDCVDEHCVVDDVVDQLTALGAKYRWAASPSAGGKTWWLVYAPDPTGYGVETHFVRWRNPPVHAKMAPGCFGIYKNGTCPGSQPDQCT